MARPKKVLYYMANDSFVATQGDDHVQVSRGDLVSADYKNRPGGDELWDPVTDDRQFVRFFQDDETATAAPGEKRGAKKDDDDDA